MNSWWQTNLSNVVIKRDKNATQNSAPYFAVVKEFNAGAWKMP